METKTINIKKLQRKAKAERRVFITLHDIVRYVVYFAGFALLGLARFEEGIAPFTVGLFAALIFCKENIFILTPVYIAGMAAASPALDTLIFACIPPAVMGLAVFTHFMIKKPLKLLHINIYAFLVHIPALVISLIGGGNAVFSVINIIVSQIFTYCAVIICYAILIRGLRHRFSADELAAGAVLLAALFTGLFKIDIYGFKIYYVAAAFAIIFSVYMYKPQAALTVSFIAGLGAALAEQNIAPAGGLFMCALVAVIFSRSNIYFSAAAVILADVIAGLYFGAFGEYGWQHPTAVAIGVLAFVAVPRKSREKLLNTFGTANLQNGIKTVINRNRADMHARLSEIGGVFHEMQEILSSGTGVIASTETSKVAMSQEMTLKLCADCPSKKECFKALGTDTSNVFIKLIDASVEKSKATLLDVPTFLSSRCSRINAALAEANDMGAKFRNKRKLNAEMQLSRDIMSAQMGGVANMLDVLSEDIKKNVTFDGERERRIVEELGFHNIIAHEVVVFTKNDGETEVNIILRDRDKHKKALTGVVSKLLKTEMLRIDDKPSELGGFVTVRLVTKPRYNVVYGEASAKKDGSTANGDTRSILRLSEDKVMFALCDGMGSGNEAFNNSSSAISMIENLYKAGFGGDMALALINKLLSLKNEEDFSALDMCVVDLRQGGADFIKMGAPEGLIVRDENTEIVAGSDLPLGILEEIKPEIQRRMLIAGDMVVMVSDGITDVMGAEEIERFIENNRTLNPQTLADSILMTATEGGKRAKDDSTVIVFRMFAA